MHPSIRRRKQPPSFENGDVERGGPEKEIRRRSHVTYDGDEYEALLKFVEVEAAKASRKESEEEEEDVKEKRLWYAPWKKVKLASKSQKKVNCSDTFTRVA
ncbi:hypothetical protein HGRIS_006701 [Hohenbuehelia grisea]|uniref:Uncharacterized protein n=1 Tax=Hohenbuehelia grisea TaxID=104357 RepID=A0ABR3J9R1_9AGAR